MKIESSRVARNRKCCIIVSFGAALIVVAAARTGADQPAATTEQLPPGSKIDRIEAVPGSIQLKNKYDYAQLLLTGVLSDGQRVDVTRMAQVEQPAALVKVSATRLVRPAADGQGELKFSLGGQSISVPVAVSGQKQDYPVNFVRDVTPTMSKMGCNAGTCHGAANGKNGFKLSLRGYDPLFDHRALTDDMAGRRFNRAAPDQSLMLLKPSGGVPHMGGVLCRPGEPYYELLRSWIAAGVKLDLNVPRVASIDVLPKNPTIPLPGMKQQVIVMATYTDGTVRDVTAEAFIESSLTEVVEVDKQGLATGIRRGEASLLARYEGAYAATTADRDGRSQRLPWQDVRRFNHLDTLVYNKLKKVKVLPSDLCSDAEFIRRIYLDLTGLPPRSDEVRAFLADSRRHEIEARRADRPAHRQPRVHRALDEQVGRPAASEPQVPGRRGGVGLSRWIRQALSDNMPYDQFVYRVLTAGGSTLENPPAAYFKMLREPGDVMENTTQLFLAVRFNCNKCHDHPFERWTQDQYYHMAAYFAQVGRKTAPEVRQAQGRRHGRRGAVAAGRNHRTISRRGEVKHIRTGAVDAAQVSLRGPGPEDRRRFAPRAARALDHVEGQSLLRQELRQPHLELPAGRRASSSRSTTSAPATRPAIPSCSTG